MWIVVFLYALCASSFTISKAVLRYAQPIFFVGFRMAVAGLFLLGIEYWKRGNRIFRIPKKDWLLFGQIIIFHIYCAYVLDLWALQYMTSYKSSFFFNLSPFITAFLSYYVLSEKITKTKWLGLTIGILGFLPELIQKAPAEDVLGGFGVFSWPEVALLGAVTSSAYGWIVMKRLIIERHYSPVYINALGMFVGGILALITSFFSEHWVQQPVVTNIKEFLTLTALIIVIINGVFYNLYGYLLHRYSATFLSFAGFMCPLFAALFGFLFLNEKITGAFILSAFLVTLGLYIFYKEELRKSNVIFFK